MANPFEKKNNPDSVLPPPWRKEAERLRTLLSPYEDLFSEIAESKNPEDLKIFLEILQTSGVLIEPMDIAQRLPASIEKSCYAKVAEAYKRNSDASRQKALKERTELLRTLDKMVAKAPKFMQMLLSEGSLVCSIMNIANPYIDGALHKHAAAAFINDIYQDLAEDKKFAIHNGLNIIDVSKTIKSTLSPIQLDAQFNENVAIYTAFDFIGSFTRQRQLGNRNISCQIVCPQEKHPFIFGKAILHILGQQIYVRISRFGGKLLLDTTLTMGISGICNNSNFEQNLQYIIWDVIIEGVHTHKLKEVGFDDSAQYKKTGVQAVAITPAVQENDSAVLAGVSSKDDKTSTSQAQDEAQGVRTIESELSNVGRESGQDSLPHQKERNYIPPLTHRQFTRGLVRCGAKIIGGGKHLKAVLNKKEATLFNPHHTERHFYASETRRILNALDISIENFLRLY